MPWRGAVYASFEPCWIETAASYSFVRQVFDFTRDVFSASYSLDTAASYSWAVSRGVILGLVPRILVRETKGLSQ